MTAAARVTAIGGGGGAAAAARVTGCRLGLGRAAGWGSDACVGETSSSARTELKSAKFLATASGHLKAKNGPKLREIFDETCPHPNC